MKKPFQHKNILMLSFLIIMWGLNWPLTKIALLDAPPILFGGIRTVLGGVVLLFVAFQKYEQLRFKETWPLYIIASFFNVVLFYGLQSIGLSLMPAGLFSAIVYLQPLLLGIFSWLWLGERMYKLKITGLILGFFGVVVLSFSGLTGEISFTGILLAIGSAVGWGGGTVFVKKISTRVNLIWMVSLQLIIGGLFLLGVGSGVESWSNFNWNLTFIINLLFISIFIIAIGWLAFFILIESGEATKVASFTFLIPFLSIIISAIFLHEAITVNLLVGLILIIISICCVNMKSKEFMLTEK